MAVTSVGKVVMTNIDDCKFTPNGGTATDIYGIDSLKIDTAGIDMLAQGDGTTIDYLSKFTHAKASIKEAALSLESLAVLLGTTVTASGADPNFTQTLNIKDTVPPYGVLVGTGTLVSTDDASATVAEAAQVKFEIKKFRINPSSLSFGVTMKDGVSVDFEGMCVPVSGVIFAITTLQTAE